MTDLVEFLRARLDEDEKQIGEDVQLGRHMWTEERLLAEVEAKRRIIDLHCDPDDPTGDRACHEVWDEWPAPEDCQTLRALAQPYADHEAFQPEWRIS